MKTSLIFTSTSEHLTESLRGQGFDIVLPDTNKIGQRLFPDGEVYIKIPKVRTLKGKRTIVIHSGAPKPNSGLIELELILQVLRDNKIRPEAFFTYFPYGQQDMVFETGETNAAKSLLKKMAGYYGVKRIFAIDPHFADRKWLKQYPFKTISVLPLLMKRAENDFGKNILFLSPDKGGARRTGIIGIEKQRLTPLKVKMCSPKTDVKGRVIGVVDDIVESGGTLLKFNEVVKKAGAKKVIALITHGLLPIGVLQVKKEFSRLYLTNTINQKESNVDIAGIISDSISVKRRCF